MVYILTGWMGKVIVTLLARELVSTSCKMTPITEDAMEKAGCISLTGKRDEVMKEENASPTEADSSIWLNTSGGSEIDGDGRLLESLLLSGVKELPEALNSEAETLT